MTSRTRATAVEFLRLCWFTASSGLGFSGFVPVFRSPPWGLVDPVWLADRVCGVGYACGSWTKASLMLQGALPVAHFGDMDAATHPVAGLEVEEEERQKFAFFYLLLSYWSLRFSAYGTRVLPRATKSGFSANRRQFFLSFAIYTAMCLITDELLHALMIQVILGPNVLAIHGHAASNPHDVKAEDCGICLGVGLGNEEDLSHLESFCRNNHLAHPACMLAWVQSAPVSRDGTGPLLMNPWQRRLRRRSILARLLLSLFGSRSRRLDDTDVGEVRIPGAMPPEPVAPNAGNAEPGVWSDDDTDEVLSSRRRCPTCRQPLHMRVVDDRSLISEHGPRGVLMILQRRFVLTHFLLRSAVTMGCVTVVLLVFLTRSRGQSTRTSSS
ncbi:hypothetical protein BJ742DRAFT_818076 [Cladochytrium replicatum]|nr:hypothetical protein BJ742DRAFT_818076 [Cladochytrium replicatum]